MTSKLKNPYLDLTPEERRETLIRAGIIDKHGKLKWPFNNDAEPPEMKTKTFDLQAALAGAKLVTGTEFDAKILSHNKETAQLFVQVSQYRDPWIFNEQGYSTDHNCTLLIVVNEEGPQDPPEPLQQTIRAAFDTARAQLGTLFSQVAVDGAAASGVVRAAANVMNGLWDNISARLNAATDTVLNDHLMRHMDGVINASLNPEVGQIWLADLSSYNYGNDYKEVEILDIRMVDPHISYPIKVQPPEGRPTLWIDSSDLMHKLKD